MIPVGTVLRVADNSGAKALKVVGIPGNSKRRFAYVGDVVTVVVKGATSVGTVKDHSIVKAMIVRTKKERRRKDGSYIRFDDNAAVILGDEKEPKGSRILGPTAKELKDKGFGTIAMMASELL